MAMPMTPIGRQLSFKNIPETPESAPTLPPTYHTPHYNQSREETSLFSSKPLVNVNKRRLEAPLVNIVPPSSPAQDSQKRSVTASPTRSVSSNVSAMSTPSGGVKGRVINYLGSFFSHPTGANATRQPAWGPLALPRASEELGAIFPRGPVSTPPRPSISHPVPPKDLIQLQHTSGPVSKVPVFKKPKTPKRLITLNHIPLPPGTLPRMKRKASTGSVRDIVRAFEEKDRERVNSSLRKSTNQFLNTAHSGFSRLRATSSMGDIKGAANQKSSIPSRSSKPLDPTTRPRWRL
jgi:hypothetical protein